MLYKYTDNCTIEQRIIIYFILAYNLTWGPFIYYIMHLGGGGGATPRVTERDMGDGGWLTDLYVTNSFFYLKICLNTYFKFV